MPGVKAILTADDLPASGRRVTAGEASGQPLSERGLTNEPLYQGEPILAVAAVDELTAAEAIEQIDIEFEPLPFVVDPLDEPAARRPERARSRATCGSRRRRPRQRQPARRRAADRRS